MLFCQAEKNVSFEVSSFKFTDLKLGSLKGERVIYFLEEGGI